MHCVYFPPEVGGLESHVYYLCRGLRERGHEVHLVTSHSMKTTPVHEVMDGIAVWRTWFPGKSPVGWAAHAIGSIPRLLEVARGAQLLHAQAFASVLPCLLAHRSTGAPLVTTYHTSHFLRRAQSRLWRPVLGRLVRVADRNLAASAELADVAKALARGVQVGSTRQRGRHRIFPARHALSGGDFQASSRRPTPLVREERGGVSGARDAVHYLTAGRRGHRDR